VRGSRGDTPNLAAVVLTVSVLTDVRDIQEVFQDGGTNLRCEVLCFGDQAIEAWQNLPTQSSYFRVVPVPESAQPQQIYNRLMQEIGYQGAAK